MVVAGRAADSAVLVLRLVAHSDQRDCFQRNMSYARRSALRSSEITHQDCMGLSPNCMLNGPSHLPKRIYPQPTRPTHGATSTCSVRPGLMYAHGVGRQCHPCAIAQVVRHNNIHGIAIPMLGTGGRRRPTSYSRASCTGLRLLFVHAVHVLARRLGPTPRTPQPLPSHNPSI